MSDNYCSKTNTSGSMWTKKSNPNSSESSRPMTKAGFLKKGNIKLFSNKVKVPNQIKLLNMSS